MGSLFRNRTARQLSGTGRLWSLALVVLAVAGCIGASMWPSAQPAPAGIPAAHFSTDGPAVQGGSCEADPACQGSSVVKAEFRSMTPLAVAEAAENKQPVGSESLTALLLLPLALILLWRRLTGARPARPSPLAAGLPAVLCCRTQGSAATLFGVFRL